MASWGTIADAFTRFGHHVTRRHPFIVFYRAGDLGELRYSLVVFYRGEALAWLGAFGLSIFFFSLKSLFAVAVVMVCLSAGMFVVILIKRRIRFEVAMLPTFMIGRIIYGAALAYALYAISGKLDLSILCLLGIVIWVPAEVMFFARSHKLVRHIS